MDLMEAKILQEETYNPIRLQMTSRQEDICESQLSFKLTSFDETEIYGMLASSYKIGT